jgi:hypothetical protein
MYAWLWRHLPGSTSARALMMTGLAAGVLVVCALWVFPVLADALAPPP